MIRFGDFELDTASKTLLKAGRPVPLRDRGVVVLEALAERAGEVVEKRELCRRAWPERDVDENNLQVEILALRRVLGRDAIVTVQGRGYQFALSVAATASATQAEVVAPDATPALVGREAELRALRDLLQPGALVTVTGEGGIGKTTLARALAAASMPRLDTQRLFVALHGLDTATAASRLSALTETTVGARCVVLDGADDVLELIAGFLATLRRAGSNMPVLLTSQEVLRVPDERVLRVSPLDDAAARALFAAATDPSCQGAPPADGYTSIFELLDGNPGALIAAARALTAGAGAARDAGLAALRAGVDATQLRSERGMLAVAAALPRGFTLEEALRHGTGGSDEWDWVEALPRWVERSLLRIEPGDPPRYALSPAARDYLGGR